MTSMPDAHALARAGWILSLETLKHLVHAGIIEPSDAQAILSRCCAFYEGSSIASDQAALAFLERSKAAAL